MAGTVTVTILGNASHLQKTLADVDESLGSKLGNIGDKFSAVGKKMTTHLTLPIVGGMALAVKAFGDFEQQLNTFRAVSGATADQMSQISKLAKDLGADVTLPGTSARDAADAMTELAKAGLSVNDTMAASKAVLQLSAAAQIGNAEAATLTANALNAFQLKGKDAIRVADLLAGTANASSAEIVDVGMAMAQAGNMFATSGIKVEELSAAIGMMANQGIKGSDAGTSLKVMMQKLIAPTGASGKMMAKLGIVASDAQGKMLPFRTIIENVTNATKDMTEAKRLNALATIFGTDAFRAGNIVLAQGTAAFDKMVTAVTKEGAAADVAAAKMKGVKGAIEALKSNVETLAISIGEKLAPFLVNISSALNGLVDRFGALSPTVQNVALVVLGVVAAIGPLIWMMGALISAVGTLSVVFTFLAANPIVLIIAGIVALVAGLVLAYKHFDAFREQVDKVARFLGDAIAPAIAAFIAYVTGQFANLVAWVKQFWPQISEAIGHVFRVIREIFGVYLDVYSALWRAWGDDLLRVVKTVWNFIRESIENAIQLIKGIIQTVVALINGDWGKAWDGIKNIVGAVWDQIGNIISTAIGGIKSLLGGLASTVGQMALGLWNPLKEGFRGVINWIISRWNALEFKMPGFDTPLGKIGGFTLGVPDIPLLAAGGIVNRPTLAMLGEAGPEAVIPLSRVGGASGGSVTFNLYVTAIDPAAAQEAVIAAIREYERRNGSNWRVA